MKFGGRFHKIEYKTRSPIHLIVLLVLIIAIILFLKFFHLR